MMRRVLLGGRLSDLRQDAGPNVTVVILMENTPMRLTRLTI